MNKRELIESEEFENALAEGAECKMEILTTYKTHNKEIFKQFQEVMYESNPEIKKILETKKKKRTEADNEQLKQFKSYISTIYKQTVDLITPEKIEPGKKSKVEKIVDKIIPVIDMLRYIDQDVLNSEFKKHGVMLSFDNSFLDKFPGLDNDNVRESIKCIFKDAKNIKVKINDDTEHINETIYSTKVPLDLQYDKQTNNDGLKSSDFKKLVDIKTKLLMAKSDEDKEKVNEKIENVATEKQFEAARAELVRDTLTKIQ